MDYGIKVSKTGVDVKTASIDDLIFTSKYPSWKVAQEGSGTVTITTGNTVGYTEVSHSLGYRPFVIAFLEPSLSAGRRRLICGRTPPTGAFVEYIQTETTKFTCIARQASAVGSDETYNFYYYAMIDQNV